MQFPQLTEYPAYFQTYIGKIDPTKGDLLTQLADYQEEVQRFLRNLSDAQTRYRYAEGKWTVRQLVQHLIDCERVMAFRALCFLRGDQTELPGFEEDDYAAAATAENLVWTDVLDEWAAVRRSTIYLFRHATEAELSRTGTANGKQFSARTFAAIILGHDLHHIQVLKTKYGL